MLTRTEHPLVVFCSNKVHDQLVKPNSVSSKVEVMVIERNCWTGYAKFGRAFWNRQRDLGNDESADFLFESKEFVLRCIEQFEQDWFTWSS